MRTAIASIDSDNPPAATVVPVRAIGMCGLKKTAINCSNNIAKYAMQVVLVDPVHMETEVWIHKDREYA